MEAHAHAADMLETFLRCRTINASHPFEYTAFLSFLPQPLKNRRHIICGEPHNLPQSLLERADGRCLFVTEERVRIISHLHNTPKNIMTTALTKLWKAIAQDLWVVLLDVLAVNASYFLALLIRFYVNSQLRPVAVDRYLPNLLAFAPWYTVLSIIVFMCWRLYGGMWRYAGINGMNRIIAANVCTTIIHVVGSLTFFTRMPITYYIIGAVLQFMMTTTTRFAYRVLLTEKNRLGSMRLEKVPVMVVGAGENGRRVVKSLEETDSYHPVAVIGNRVGTMDGTPIYPLSEMADVISKHKIKSVFIADSLLTNAQRDEINRIATTADLELHDYTGYFSNLGGRLSLTELLAVIHSPVSIVLNGETKRFEDGAAALSELREKYTVEGIKGQDMTIKLVQRKRMTTQEALMLEYAAVMGDEGSPGGQK